MNLNKYDSQGWLYSEDEARERAIALFSHNYVAKGYRRGINEKTGLPRIEATLKPLNVGRNVTKRKERALRGVRK